MGDGIKGTPILSPYPQVERELLSDRACRRFSIGSGIGGYGVSGHSGGNTRPEFLMEALAARSAASTLPL
jgi:hypothetical protein